MRYPLLFFTRLPILLLSLVASVVYAQYPASIPALPAIGQQLIYSSTDGQTIVLLRDGDLRVGIYTADRWRFTSLAEEVDVSAVTINREGDLLMYVAPGPDGGPLGFYAQPRVGDAWGEAQFLRGLQGLRPRHVHLVVDGSLLFTAERGSQGPGLYRSALDDSKGYLAPEYLSSLNTHGAEDIAAVVQHHSAKLMLLSRIGAHAGLYLYEDGGQGWTLRQKLRGVAGADAMSVLPSGELVLKNGAQLRSYALDTLELYWPQWEVFMPGLISLDNIRETSPSMSADGNAMVFARTSGWVDKRPYLAERIGERWEISRLPYLDTVYNLAISPDAQRIFFKVYTQREPKQISKNYVMDRKGEGWAAPVEIETFYELDAGYFYPHPNDTLYLFARAPQAPGIYRSVADGPYSYSLPQRLSPNLGKEGRTCFDAVLNEKANRMIATTYPPEGEGLPGFYYHEKVDGRWDRGTLITGLPYGWGATITSDGRFLFVDEGDLQVMDFAQLGLQW